MRHELNIDQNSNHCGATLRQERPAVYAFCSLAFPVVIFRALSNLFIIVVIFVALGVILFYSKWRVPTLKVICVFLCLLAAGRIYYVISVSQRILSCSQEYTSLYFIKEILWTSERSEKVCVLASREGVNVALILPLAYRDSDIIRATAIPEEIESQRNPGGFDEINWLAGKGIFLKLRSRGEVTVVKTIGGFRYLRQIFYERSERWLSQYLGERNASILTSILLGYKSNLSPVDRISFSTLSLSHLLSVSGMHLSFLLAPLRALTINKKLGRKGARIVTYGICIAWLYLSKFSPGFLRALSLYFLRDYARMKGLRNDAINQLALAASGALLINPFLLLNRGALWSYLASASIFLFSENICLALISKWPSLASGFADRIAALISAQIAILLISLDIQGSVDLVYLLFQLPLCTMCEMIFVLGLPLQILAALFLKQPWWILKLIIYGLNSLLSLFRHCVHSLALHNFPRVFSIPLNAFVVTTIILIIVHFLLKNKFPNSAGYVTKIKTGINTLAVILVISSMIYSNLARSSSIFFLDVGQGDGFVITNEYYTVTIDGGTKEKAFSVWAPFFSAKGMRQIDLAIVTHADADHAGAVLELMKLGLVKKIAVPEFFAPEDYSDNRRVIKSESEKSNLGSEILMEAGNLNIAVIRLVPEDTINLGQDILLRVLLAGKKLSSDPSDSNDSSLVMELKHFNNRILLTGDCTPEKEKLIIEQDTGPADILKVSHHGAKDTTKKELLDAVLPSLAIISVGKNNNYNHPHPDLMARLADSGCEVLRTDKDGAIKLEFVSPEKLCLKTWVSKKIINVVK